jgi:FMN phosphatase YigB (HAD superfamily)
MATARAFVFDAYGTLFDVHSVVTTLQAVTADAEAVGLLCSGQIVAPPLWRGIAALDP